MKNPIPKANLIAQINEMIEDHHYKKNHAKSPRSKRNYEFVLQLFQSIKHHLEQ